MEDKRRVHLRDDRKRIGGMEEEERRDCDIP